MSETNIGLATVEIRGAIASIEQGETDYALMCLRRALGNLAQAPQPWDLLCDGTHVASTVPMPFHRAIWMADYLPEFRGTWHIRPCQGF